MNLLLVIAMPQIEQLPLRLGLLFLLGAVLGGLINLAIYRWAWRKWSISPWSAPPSAAPPRAWSDRLPIVGWLGLRREAAVHGAGFWIRPLLIELALAVGLPWLYWWEIVQQALVPMAPAGVLLPLEVLHQQYFSHVLLIVLMAIATFIDIDDRIIPDQITVTGTLAGLLLAALAPWSLLPELQLLPAPPAAGFAIPLELPPFLAGVIAAPNALYLQFLMFTSPNPWPAVLGGQPRVGPLLLGLGCYWLWIFAILPRRWYARHGVRRGLAVLTARMRRALLSLEGLLYLLLGSAGIAVVWSLGGARWAGLLTALVGLAGSGGIVWAVRLIGAVTLRKEAMGFGDVLLMMMIGAFLGWQAGLIIFFMAPFAGLVIGLTQLIVRRDQSIPYGPFLCLAALVTLVFWARVWIWAEGVFSVGWLVPGVLVICLVVMTVMLLLLRLAREAVFGREE